MRDSPDHKEPVAVSAGRRRQHIQLTRSKLRRPRFFPELEPSGLNEFVDIIPSLPTGHENEMLSIPCPLSTLLVGILWPIQYELMRIAAIGIQFPDLGRILVRHSQHRHANALRVGRKIRHIDLRKRIPYLLEIRALPITYVKRVHTGINNRMAVGRPMRIFSNLVSQLPRITAQDRNRPDRASSSLVIQIRL